MRILFFANDFPNPYRPNKGPFNRHLTRALAKIHDVEVISPIPWVDEVKARVRGHAAFDRARRAVLDGALVQYPRYYYSPGILQDRSGWFYWRSVNDAVRRVFDVAQPDLVLAYWAHPDGEAAVRAARLAGVPSAVIVGGSDVLIITLDRTRRRRVVEVLGATDAVACVSATLRARVLELGIAADRVHVWRQGIDARLFHPGDQAEARRRLGIDGAERVVVYVGRMIAVKGLDVLLDAMAMYHEPGIGPRLFLVGEGPLRSSLEAQARALGLSARVTFLGPMTQEEIGDWFRAADLTVLPSRSEGVPNVLRESQACGTPFVASAVGGIAEIADPARDRLVPPGDAMALAEAICFALRQPKHGEIQTCGSPSWEESARSLLSLVKPGSHHAAAA
jgi:glycosyltransferase involved in cell wall biosynthesis